MSLLEIYLDPKPDGGNVFVKSCFTKYFESCGPWNLGCPPAHGNSPWLHGTTINKTIAVHTTPGWKLSLSANLPRGCAVR